LDYIRAFCASQRRFNIQVNYIQAQLVSLYSTFTPVQNALPTDPSPTPSIGSINIGIVDLCNLDATVPLLPAKPLWESRSLDIQSTPPVILEPALACTPTAWPSIDLVPSGDEILWPTLSVIVLLYALAIDSLVALVRFPFDLVSLTLLRTLPTATGSSTPYALCSWIWPTGYSLSLLSPDAYDSDPFRRLFDPVQPANRLKGGLDMWRKENINNG